MLTFWNSNNITTLWNSKSEVIKCLHGQGGQKQRIRSQVISRSELMIKPQRGLMNIAKPIALHGRRQYAAEYIYFWRKNKNIGPLLYLGGQTVNRYIPDLCGSGINILLYLPQKVNYDFLTGGIFFCLRKRILQDSDLEDWSQSKVKVLAINTIVPFGIVGVTAEMKFLFLYHI